MIRWAAIVALAAVACSKPAPPVDDDPTAAVPDAARAVVRTGPVGASKPADASYVLVDVANVSPKDRLVTVGGALLDESGATVATLSADELRIPAKSTRTYALVADHPVPAARRATFKVLNAVAVDYPPQVVIEDEQLKRGDLTVVAATARNVIDRDATAVVAATFYGKDGAILSRPFTVVPLPASSKHAVRFEGAKDAERVVMFVGQIAFHP